jgi:hypothetical protein
MGRPVTICQRLLNLRLIVHGYGIHLRISPVLPSIQNREPPAIQMASVCLLDLLPSSRSVSSRVRPESDMDVLY